MAFVNSSLSLVEKSQAWLSQEAVPLWTGKGFDPTVGMFVEGILFDGDVVPPPVRAMVQSRQIYSLSVADKLKAIPHDQAIEFIRIGANLLLDHFSLPSGGFAHSADAKKKVIDPKSDLYNQAFALFGLANAFEVQKNPNWKQRAKTLIEYLRRERRAPGGGFTEIGTKGDLFQSNPHMHLFEAAITWMAVDPDPEWRLLAEELSQLCQKNFIQEGSGVLCEHFEPGWIPQRENGKFILEPGHHFEWAWLFMMYEELGGHVPSVVYKRLFEVGEAHGLLHDGRVAIDELWSDLTPKKKTARYWPQCERAKAALQLAKRSSGAERERYLRSADQSMETLFRYLNTPVKGLCFDVLLEDGTFSSQPPKASFLYHVANAIYEYVRLRPTL